MASAFTSFSGVVPEAKGCTENLSFHTSEWWSLHMQDLCLLLGSGKFLLSALGASLILSEACLKIWHIAFLQKGSRYSTPFLEAVIASWNIFLWMTHFWKEEDVRCEMTGMEGQSKRAQREGERMKVAFSVAPLVYPQMLAGTFRGQCCCVGGLHGPAECITEAFMRLLGLLSALFVPSATGAVWEISCK